MNWRIDLKDMKNQRYNRQNLYISLFIELIIDGTNNIPLRFLSNFTQRLEYFLKFKPYGSPYFLIF